MSKIGDNIKFYRKKYGLTLEDVAKATKVSRQTIQRYENGIINNIPSDKIEMMAKKFNTSPAKLMGWEEIDTLLIDESHPLGEKIQAFVHNHYDSKTDSNIIEIRMPSNFSGKDFSNLYIKEDLVKQILETLCGSSEDKSLHFLSNAEMDHIYKYRGLDEKGQHAIDTILEMEHQRCSNLVETFVNE